MGNRFGRKVITFFQLNSKEYSYISKTSYLYMFRHRQARRRHQIMNETARGVNRVKFVNSLSMNSTGFGHPSYGNSSVINPDGTLNLPKFPNKRKLNRRTTLREEDELDDSDDEEQEE